MNIKKRVEDLERAFGFGGDGESLSSEERQMRWERLRSWFKENYGIETDEAMREWFKKCRAEKRLR